MNRVQAPSTAKSTTQETRITNTRNDIWVQSVKPHFMFETPAGFAANKIRLSPKRTLGGDDIFIIPYRVIDPDGDASNVVIYLSLYWDIDLSAAGINLATFIGGRVDGIAQEANRAYLVWAFFDPTLGGSGFQGIGITRKPYSAFSSVATGTKGSTATLTVTNAYQFTIGALVVVRNTVGTAPLYEFNLGTVASIVSNTSITVTLHNNSAYGTNITAATGGEIQQWNNFKPYIVTTSSQTPYKPTYALLGEIYTASTNVLRAHTINDEFREMLRPEIFNSTATIATPTAVNLLRYLPPWVDQSSLQVVLNPNATAVSISVTVNGSTIMFVGSNNSTYSAAGHLMNTGYVFLEKNAQIMVTKNNTVNGFVYILGYRIEGGMRP